MCKMLVVSVLATLLLGAGCALIVQGKRAPIGVGSSPTGARVLVDGDLVATTPTLVEIRRKREAVVLRIEKDGYAPAEVVLTRQLSGWLVGNLLLSYAAPLGVVVDMASGAAYNLSPTNVQTVLQPLDSKVPLRPAVSAVARHSPNSVAKSRDDSPLAGRRWSPFTLGYGISGIWLILPVPFVDAGVALGPVGVRGSVGFVLAYAEGRVELVLLDRFFVYGGINSVVQSEGAGDIYGIGMDVRRKGSRYMYRGEVMFWRPGDSRIFAPLLRVGLVRKF